MSQNYKFKSLQFSGKPEEVKKEKDFSELKVFEVGETKTINFIMLDGSQQNFTYSHYITSWLGIEKNENIIKIFFATHLVTIEGYCLDEIYNKLIKLSIVWLKSNDKRFEGLNNSSDAFVTDIKVTWKSEVNM